MVPALSQTGMPRCTFRGKVRLLKASTIELEDFPPNRIPPYAILSHTWEGQEVLYDDLQRHIAEEKASWDKVKSTCEQTLKDGLEYVWIDSCCIDKSSSAELSEAINSMYAWYEKATICYAYLCDVSPGDHTIGCAFEDSRWFRRGWTLQELIAPSEVIFFSHDWVEIGKKSELTGPLSEVTRIDEEILTHRRRLRAISVARRMAWASYRETTRPEDVAYCLMGIFSVNMPLLYGEGEKAFVRLQEEIMKQSDDQSIFAWVDSDESPATLHGLLATSPSKFVDCHQVIAYQDWEPRQPYAMTNRGLQIRLPITHQNDDVYVAALDCPGSRGFKAFRAIYLLRLSPVDEQYARTHLGTLMDVSERGALQTIYVRQDIVQTDEEGAYPTRAIQIRSVVQGFWTAALFAYLDWYRMLKLVVSPQTETTINAIRPRSTLPRECSNRAFIIQNGGVTLFATFGSNDGRGILISLGPVEGFGVGFDGFNTPHPNDFTLSDSPTVDELSEPKKPGTWIALENHLVKVNAEPCILPFTTKRSDGHNAIKCFMVDITIEKRFPGLAHPTLDSGTVVHQNVSMSPQRMSDNSGQ